MNWRNNSERSEESSSNAAFGRGTACRASVMNFQVPLEIVYKKKSYNTAWK